jgi:hypothetical protein
MMMARTLLAFLVAGLISMIAGGVRAESIVLASTTSVEDSGLLAHILPAFTAGSGIGRSPRWRAATPTLSWCTTPRPRTASSPKGTTGTSARSPGTIS